MASPRVNQYEMGIHEPRPAAVKKLAEALGIPPACLYAEDDLLARLLLHWNELSLARKKALLKLAEQSARSKPRTET